MVTNKRPDKIDYFHIEEVIPEAIRAHDNNVALLDIVNLCVCFRRVITSGSYLKGEIKAMLLFL